MEITEKDKNFLKALKSQGVPAEEAYQRLLKVKGTTTSNENKIPSPYEDPVIRANLEGSQSTPQGPGASIGAPWQDLHKPSEYTADDFLSSPVGQFAQKQAPQLEQAMQEEADLSKGPLEIASRGLRVVGQAAGGVGNTLWGVGNTVAGVGRQAWDLPGNISNAIQGKPQNNPGADQAMAGLNQVVGGIGQTVSAPLAVSPVLQKGASLPFEAMSDTINGSLQQAGIDTESEHGKIIAESLLNGLSMAIVGPKNITKGITGALDSGASFIKNRMNQAQKVNTSVVSPARADRVVKNRVKELTKIQENNTVIRKAIESAENKGIDVKTELAKTDLLKGAVDNDGTIRTQGAIEKLNEFIKPQEDVVGSNLRNEGKTISLADVEKKLKADVQKSGVKGGALVRALKNVEADIEGYRLEANSKGEIPVATLHDAKVDKYSNIDYLNPESSRVDKTIAKSLKNIVEENSSVDVKGLNKELSKYYSMQSLLEKLNGRKVKGGRLGKYVAQTAGTIVGSALGPLGAIVGGEIAKGVQGATMGRTFKGSTGAELMPSGAMQKAIETGGSKNVFANKQPKQLPTKNNLQIAQKGMKFLENVKDTALLSKK